MIADGNLDVVVDDPDDGHPWYRWRYITVHAAEFLGPRRHKSKAAARKDGERWLGEQRTQ